MSSFALNENKDGTVTLTRKNKIYAEVCGKVSYVNYKNRSIFTIHAEKMGKKFRCILNYDNPFCPLKDGDVVHGIAEYVKDSRYGDTLKFVKPPFVVLGKDKQTLINSFSTALRGTRFGKVKAENLFNELLDKTGNLDNIVKTLDNMASYVCYKNVYDPVIFEPYSLVAKPYQMKKLMQWWYRNRCLRKLWLLGINNKEIRGSRVSPNEMHELCLKNPYIIPSVPLTKCDDIDKRLNLNTDKKTKKCAEIVRTMTNFMNNNGWVGVPSNIIVSKYANIKEYMEELKENFKIKAEHFTLYLNYPHEVETEVASIIHDLMDREPLNYSLHENELTFTRNDLTEQQKMVITKCFKNNITIIKGAAGTGKTTIIKEIVHNLDRNKIKYKVVSFTGKAVSRIREVTGKVTPMTMHLSIAKSVKESEFNYLIVDEASMVTTELLYKFCMNFGHDYRMIFIGDPNQLLPISWGTLFDELINSGRVPTYNLGYCHRVANENGGILENSNLIVETSESDYNGPPFQFVETDDFNIFDGDVGTIKELLEILKENGENENDITILSPFNKYLNELNYIYQNIFGSGRKSVTDINRNIWMEEDRVMMIENNYNINVMNGDEGKITSVQKESVTVKFKNNKEYTFLMDKSPEDEKHSGMQDSLETSSYSKELYVSSLVQSYAVSVHRYQGSENDIIIFYIPKSNPSKFLNRNLLYTGITRAKKCIYLVGDYDTMLSTASMSPPYRCDNLALRLKEKQKIVINK